MSYLFLLYKSFKILYSTYHKPNGGIHVFKMKHKKFSNLFSCVYVENYHFLNGILGGCIFWFNLL
jgi:hypothetical protein